MARCCALEVGLWPLYALEKLGKSAPHSVQVANLIIRSVGFFNSLDVRRRDALARFEDRHESRGRAKVVRRFPLANKTLA